MNTCILGFLVVALLCHTHLPFSPGCFAYDRDPILATIGDLHFTDHSLQDKLDRLPEETREQYQSPEGREEFLKELLRIEVFSREAVEVGVDQEESVKAKIADIARAVLAQEYVNRKILSKAVVTEEDAQHYYSLFSNKFKKPEKIKLSSIYIPVPREASPAVLEEKRARAESALGRVRKGEDFAKIAAELSDRPAQWDSEYFARGRLVPEIEAAVFALQKGDVSPTLRVEGGFVLFKPEDRIPESIAPYEAVSGSILDRLREEKKQALFEKDEKRLFAKYNVVIKSTSGQNAPASPNEGGISSSLEGRIIKVEKADPSARQLGTIGSILLQLSNTAGAHSDQAVITITERTTVFLESGSDRKPASFDDLKHGRLIDAETSRTAMSYPVQAEATLVTILQTREQ